MTVPDDDDRMLELIYEESVRGLEAQERELESVHLRASFVLAGAGVAAAALGQSGRHGAFAGLALLSFLVSAGLAVFTFLPPFGNWQVYHHVHKNVCAFGRHKR